MVNLDELDSGWSGSNFSSRAVPPGFSLAELRSAVDAEWVDLQAAFDDLLRRHKRRQDDLFDQYGQTAPRAAADLSRLGKLTEEVGQHPNKAGLPLVGRSPRSARHLSRLMELNENLSCIVPKSSLRLQEAQASVASPGSAASGVALDSLDLRLSPMSASLERIERVLWSQVASYSPRRRPSQAHWEAEAMARAKPQAANQVVSYLPRRRPSHARSEADDAALVRTKFGMAATPSETAKAMPQAANQGLRRASTAPVLPGPRLSRMQTLDTDLTPNDGDAFANPIVKGMILSEQLAEDRSVVEKFVRRRFTKLHHWFESLVEPPRSGFLARTLSRRFFDTACGMVIFTDCSSTVFYMNYQMDHLDNPENDAVVIVGYVCLAGYSLELLVKLLVHRWYFFTSGKDICWNWFDFLLVLTSVADALVSAYLDGGTADVSFMRAIRFLKLARILRGLRLMRFFQELRVMLNSIVGSVSSLFWSVVMLALIIYLFSLVFLQGTVNYCLATHIDPEDEVCPELRRQFGSVQLAMLSLFKVALGGEDWGNYYSSTELIGTFEAAVFLFFVSFIYIALMNVLTGIFVENAMQFAQPDRENLALEKRKQQIQDAAELRRVFLECKASSRIEGGHEHTIGMDEFMAAMHQPRLRSLLETLGLDIWDARIFFTMLASQSERDGAVEIDQFVEGCMRLKGPASSIDLQSIALQNKTILKQVKALREECMIAATSEAAAISEAADLIERSGGEGELRPQESMMSEEATPPSDG